MARALAAAAMLAAATAPTAMLAAAAAHVPLEPPATQSSPRKKAT